MKRCTICNEPLNKEEKENRTEHFACRQVKRFRKNGSYTAKSRRKKAFDILTEKPKLFARFF